MLLLAWDELLSGAGSDLEERLSRLLWMLDDIQQVGTEALSARDKIVCSRPRNVGLRGARTIRTRFLCCSLTRDSLGAIVTSDVGASPEVASAGGQPKRKLTLMSGLDLY